MDTGFPNTLQPQQADLTNRRLGVFEQRYGVLALELACHAAFPLTLTTDLVYCLRENFVPDCPWYGAADVLLSGLCSAIGYDLYEMEGSIRDRLLRRLREAQSETRLYQLEDFMVAYLQHRLQVEKSDRPLVLGDRPHWTVLACLHSEELIIAIERELRRVIGTSDPKERLRLATLVERHVDILSETRFRPLLLDWANRAARDEPIEADVAVALAAAQLGIRFQPFEFDVATVQLPRELPFQTQQVEVVTAEVEEDVPAETEPFEFEVATLEREETGWVIHRSRQQGWRFIEPLEGSVGLEMVYIPSGEFLMGSPEDEPGRFDDETPQHRVRVPKFHMSRYQVTQAQWYVISAFPKVNRDFEPEPSAFSGDDRPVEGVSWYDAVEFCSRLSRQTGRTYRLPTEAEWEYACRAGTTTPFHFGETMTAELANYDGSSYQDEPEGESQGETTPVDQFKVANAFGLSDMHGNVWEWCLDLWHENYDGAPADGRAWNVDGDSDLRILRGGSWSSSPRNCRSATRYFNYPDYRTYDVGFRVVCEMP